jgi:hypothetical protein
MHLVDAVVIVPESLLACGVPDLKLDLHVVHHSVQQPVENEVVSDQSGSQPKLRVHVHPLVGETSAHRSGHVVVELLIDVSLHQRRLPRAFANQTATGQRLNYNFKINI